MTARTPTLTLPLRGGGNLALSPSQREGWGEGNYPFYNLNYKQIGPILGQQKKSLAQLEQGSF